MRWLFFGAFIVIGSGLANAGCRHHEPAVAGAWKCSISYRLINGLKTYKATYCCIDKSTPKGNNSIYCKDYGNDRTWSKPEFTCSVDVSCGPIRSIYHYNGTYSFPKHGSQCKDGKTAPATRCLDDKSSALLHVPKDDVIQRHNCWRSIVKPAADNLQPLKWDDELALLAERWAAQCPTHHDSYKNRSLPYRSTNGVSWKYVGQNICYSHSRTSWSQCIDRLAREKKDFEYGKGSINGKKVGHYTQLVAQRSWFVGCGEALCHGYKYKYFKVCNYGPAGNYVGGKQRPYKLANANDANY